MSAILPILMATLLQRTPADTLPRFRAEVSRDHATFVFPVPVRPEWPFNDGVVLNTSYQYVWQVELMVGDTAMGFGYSLWDRSRPTVPASRVHFISFNDFGQRNVWKNGKAEFGTEILTTFDPGRVIIELDDAGDVARFFASKPKAVVFRYGMPGDTLKTIVVPVKYTAKPLLIAGGRELKHAADFKLPVLVKAAYDSGDPTVRRLSHDKGRVVVLYFWDTGCKPCTEEFPQIAEQARLWAPKRVQFYGVVVGDTRSNVEKFLSTQTVPPFTQLDGTAGTEGQFGGRGTPYLVIIDRDGDVVYARFGATLGAGALSRLLESRLTPLLGKKQ